MTIAGKAGNKGQVYIKYVIAAIILAGIIARLIVYFQNRNLIIDESNIARNLYERNFAGLALPLKYEQYAPPVFLWIEKLNTITFGFSEYALRLWPLLCGMAAMFVMYRLLKQLGVNTGAWYPLLLLAGTHICIRYSSEVKQYMPDVLIVLSLMSLALQSDTRKYSAARFCLLWFTIGSIAIWSSMPSVFVLAGVGAYYGWKCINEKNYRKIWPVIITGGLWLVQFALYYLIILKPQANSDYLQRFHQYDFFHLTPNDAGEWNYNIDKYRNLAGQFAGIAPYALLINTVFLVAGIIALIKKDLAKALLLLVPLAAMLFAAGLKQYSLMPRVALFSIPLMMVLAGYGFHFLWEIGPKALKAGVLILAFYVAYSNIDFSLHGRYKYEQLTEGLDYLQKKGITGDYLYIYWSSGPAFTYYTQIHPQRRKWQSLVKGSTLLPWDRDYTALSWEMQHTWLNTQPVGFVFTNGTNEEVYTRERAMRNFMKEKARYDKPSVKAFIYQKN